MLIPTAARKEFLSLSQTVLGRRAKAREISEATQEQLAEARRSGRPDYHEIFRRLDAMSIAATGQLVAAENRLMKLVRTFIPNDHLGPMVITEGRGEWVWTPSAYDGELGEIEPIAGTGFLDFSQAAG